MYNPQQPQPPMTPEQVEQFIASQPREMQVIYRLLDHYGDRFTSAFSRGFQPSEIYVALQNEIVQKYDINQSNASAIVSLAIEHANIKQSGKGNYSPAQINQLWEQAFGGKLGLPENPQPQPPFPSGTPQGTI